MKLPILVAATGLMLLGTGVAQAHPGYQRHHHGVVHRPVVVRAAPVQHALYHLTDVRVSRLPAGSVTVVSAGLTLHRHGKVYYVRDGADYVVVKPRFEADSVRILARID